MKIGTGTTPLQHLGDTDQLYFFSLRLDNDDTYRAPRTPTFNLWHRRMGHINSSSLKILSKVDSNGLNCDGDGMACDVWAIGKSAQQAHPKKALYNTGAPFQLVFSDLMGLITPEALDTNRYASKLTDAMTRWKGIYLLKNKNDAVASLKLFNQAVVIPS